MPDVIHTGKTMKKPTAKPMSFSEYWEYIGTENVKLIIEMCESSIGYFRLIKYGYKKPGGILAIKIIRAARAITPGIEPDLELMLSAEPRPVGVKIDKKDRTYRPHPRFLEQMAKRLEKMIKEEKDKSRVVDNVEGLVTSATDVFNTMT